MNGLFPTVESSARYRRKARGGPRLSVTFRTDDCQTPGSGWRGRCAIMALQNDAVSSVALSASPGRCQFGGCPAVRSSRRRVRPRRLVASSPQPPDPPRRPPAARLGPRPLPHSAASLRPPVSSLHAAGFPERDAPSVDRMEPRPPCSRRARSATIRYPGAPGAGHPDELEPPRPDLAGRRNF